MSYHISVIKVKSYLATLTQRMDSPTSCQCYFSSAINFSFSFYIILGGEFLFLFSFSFSNNYNSTITVRVLLAAQCPLQRAVEMMAPFSHSSIIRLAHLQYQSHVFRLPNMPRLSSGVGSGMPNGQNAERK